MMNHYLAVALASERRDRLLVEAHARRQAREARATNPRLAPRLARAARRLSGWGQTGPSGRRRLRRRLSGRLTRLRPSRPGCGVEGGT